MIFRPIFIREMANDSYLLLVEFRLISLSFFFFSLDSVKTRDRNQSKKSFEILELEIDHFHYWRTLFPKYETRDRCRKRNKNGEWREWRNN